jgi:HAD superfamily hydrolase (TIGR01549 family)
MKKIKGIIFDFDGVICESLEVKTEAFRKLFLDYPDQLDRILRIHIENGGMSRYLKFEIVYRDILKKKLNEEESKRLGKLFTEYCYQGVVNSAYVKGAKEFLDKYHQHFPLFVISGTPEEEMVSIIQERNMRHYFKGVFGSPRLKGDLTALILKENDLGKDEVVFVGDSVNDLQGARFAQVRFIARMHGNDIPREFYQLSAEDQISDFVGLEKLLVAQKLI